MPTLAIIIVSWNVADLLQRCLQTVETSLAGSHIPYEIVVVDNASSDGTPTMVRAEFPHVQLLQPGRNLGFAAGNNIALRALGLSGEPGALHTVSQPDGPTRSPDDSPSFVLLLNPDTEVVGDALIQLVAYLDRHPDVLAVGPRLRYADGTIQSSRRRFPNRITFFWESTPLERLWPANPWARHYHCADGPPTQEQRVDWLVGAALLVRGAAIVHAGLLDERFFMYSEELEWQYRLQRVGNRGRIMYLPHAEVIHHEGRSSEQVLPGRHIHFQRSKLRLARLFYGTVFAEVLRVFLLAGYVWELLSESAKYLLGHRRSLRRQRMMVYATVLRSGLR